MLQLLPKTRSAVQAPRLLDWREPCLRRARVVCSSFLVKNLLLPWQWGLKHFWDCLLDADLEAAALGWQYCSGCLTGAPPLSPGGA